MDKEKLLRQLEACRFKEPNLIGKQDDEAKINAYFEAIYNAHDALVDVVRGLINEK